MLATPSSVGRYEEPDARPRQGLAAYDGRYGEFLVNTTYGDETKPVLACFQGIVQSPSDASATALHRGLHGLFDTTVLTIGNNGVDTAAGVDNANRVQTAADRIALLRKLPGFADKRFILIGMSLGAQTVHDMLSLTLQQPDALPVSRAIYLGPGIVEPGRASERMAQLPLNLAATTLRSWGQNIWNMPSQAAELGNTIWRTIWNNQPSAHQAEMIGAGTSLDDIEKVVAQYPLHVIAGAADALNEHEMWQSLSGRQPNVTYELVAGRGHELVFTDHLALNALHGALTQA